MPSLTLRGISVDFPFTPYPCQLDYMSKVIECLQNKKNGVLESPTGTGKTLCLLCAALGWRAYFKDSISARKVAERMGGAELFPDRPMSSWGTAATDGETPAYYTDVSKIIYASRTHSQLAQVISELKNTSYRPKICVLGSREQLCINQEVMKHESNHVKVHMCRAKVSSRSCVFYNNVDEKSTDKDIINSVLDVEDLVKTGKKQRVCPYYLSRSLKQQADLIFMPYNYLLDPKSRRAHNIELKGAVVIFDEAHNVEKMCEESTSFDLTPYDLTSAIDAVDKVLKEQASDIGNGESSEYFNAESSNSGLKMDLPTIAKIKQILMDLETAINDFEMPSNDQGITKPGSYIYELFQMAHVTFDTKTVVVEVMEQITGYLAGRPGIFLNTSGLQKVTDIIQLVFAVEPVESCAKSHMRNSMQQFKVHIHADTSNFKKKQHVDLWASSSRKQGNVLSYWCFSPGFSMQELMRQEVRCIILTSGTLSPLSSFTCEMQIPFPVSLENPHVIQKDQIFVSIVDKGPDGVQLSTAFDKRFLPQNMASLGNTIVNLSRVVPHGLLVFFPSYPVLDKMLEYWRASGHVDRIESMKPMFVEPKGKGTFAEVIDGYYDRVNDSKTNGGSFFAVCRGKVSEGLDFADTYGRGVIITGLPYPPRMDPRVVLKMQYLDEMCRNKTSGVKHLSGQEWYRQQASRAVNQAIGRVIRHRDDYGAIFLCDYRFKNSDVRQQLPSWVRPYVRTHENFGTVVRDAAQFFRVAQKLRPVPEKKVKGAGCTNQTVKDSFQTSPGCSTSAQNAWECCSSLKAKVFDSHVPSLKKRKLDEGSEKDGTARLCVQYEMEMSSSKNRHMSLLDALDKSDGNHKEDDPLFGEQKPSRLSTLSLQYDKRMDNESRGGRRKIRVVQDQKPIASSATDKGKAFMLELKRNLSQESYMQIIQALQLYKATNNLNDLMVKAADLLIQDHNTHILLRGLYQFVRPHHKKQFHEKCQLLTGEGCSYKPEHSLSREERALLMKETAKQETPETHPSTQLDSSRQLNHGGSHLGTQNLCRDDACLKDQKPQQAGKEHHFSETLLSDMKRTIGTEKTNQLFLALKTYKKTNDYDQMIATVVGLLTERDEDIMLLKRLTMYIPAHHRQQFSEMLSSLTGSVPEPCQNSGEVSSPPVSVSQLCAGKSQSKISSFFS